MTLSLKIYEKTDEGLWDEFCKNSHQATFLHERCFLNYHGEKFKDLSLIIEEEGECVGLFVAAEDLRNSQKVVSHPGITYGGVIHQGKLKGLKMLELFECLRKYYLELGYTKLLYKAVPFIYHQVPAQDDLYALFRVEAVRIRCDLSSSIDLSHRLSVSERRRRSFKKAVKAGVFIEERAEFISDLWKVLEANLASKHDAQPVHSLSEINLLMSLYPENIKCVVARLEGAVIAGVVLFLSPRVSHAQYIASSDLGYSVSALDLVFEHCIDKALKENKRFFDFGISNEQGGFVLNNGLYQFKSEFGGGGVVHEFFEWDLMKYVSE